MCTSKVRLDGKIVVITGANTGIGIETVIDLAKRGATVIMACRNLDKSKAAIERAKKESSGSNDIILMRLNLSSLKSVREFAEEFLSKYSRLNILINNAGVMMIPYSKTRWVRDANWNKLFRSFCFDQFVIESSIERCASSCCYRFVWWSSICK